MAGDAEVAPDLRLHDVFPGDRYLLCSDGLSTVVPDEEIRGVLTRIPDTEQAARELITLANRRGGPDNISCVIGDGRVPPQSEPRQTSSDEPWIRTGASTASTTPMLSWASY